MPAEANSRRWSATRSPTASCTFGLHSQVWGVTTAVCEQALTHHSGLEAVRQHPTSHETLSKSSVCDIPRSGMPPRRCATRR